MNSPGDPGPAKPDPGSFRDPTGQVVDLDGRILRVVRPAGAEQYRAFRDSGLLDELVSSGWLVGSTEVPHPDQLGIPREEVAHVLEHPRLPFISYPYEWPFAALQAAALLHLDTHLRALEHGFTLSDATAFNIQFDGPRPMFIDHLSFRPYKKGEYWLGHRQFCEQFLNPLVLEASCGLSYHAMYRAGLSGIDGALLSRLLPWYRQLKPLILLHVTLPSLFQRRHGDSSERARPTSELPLESFRNMLSGLRRGIAAMKLPKGASTTWSDYAQNTVYATDETRAKHHFVRELTTETRPQTVWDLGCNTGDYAATCLEAGAKRVIGFEGDPTTATMAFERAGHEQMAFLPLVMDLANPSPSQGWREMERGGLGSRDRPDAVLALALLHHLVIQNNVPLDNAIEWLVSLAPVGVIEFVPKSDPMVRRMLALRDDIFPDYTEAKFRASIAQRATITKEAHVTEGGRLLLQFQA